MKKTVVAVTTSFIPSRVHRMHVNRHQTTLSRRRRESDLIWSSLISLIFLSSRFVPNKNLPIGGANKLKMRANETERPARRKKNWIHN